MQPEPNPRSSSIAVVFGTRPELIKLTPVIRALSSRLPGRVRLVDTGQQQELVNSLLREYDLGHLPRALTRPDRASLHAQLGSSIAGLEPILRDCAGVVVHGDTLSTLAGSLAAFYLRKSIVHVEAGLRTHDLAQPFPEEANRRICASLAALHIAPSRKARDNLLAEGVSADCIKVLGNPLSDLVRDYQKSRCRDKQTSMPAYDVIVTMHRRENRQTGIRQLCLALDRIRTGQASVHIAVIRHPHPEVHRRFLRYMTDHPNTHYINPLDHRSFLGVLSGARLVITDSGGIQEESAMLGRPTLVLRKFLDREDGIASKNTVRVDVCADRIAMAAGQILERPASVSTADSTTADGSIGEKIAQIAIEKFFATAPV